MMYGSTLALISGVSRDSNSPGFLPPEQMATPIGPGKLPQVVVLPVALAPYINIEIRSFRGHPDRKLLSLPLLSRGWDFPRVAVCLTTFGGTVPLPGLVDGFCDDVRIVDRH